MTARPCTTRAAIQLIASGNASDPLIGKVVRDTARDRLGQVMGRVGPRYQLRPVKGGREWEAKPSDIEPLDEATRCERCTKIKTARAKAYREGRRVAVHGLTVVLSRHLRTEHS
ncbi:hypothetical protein VR41_08920 [Streptomyces sp. NRRL B-1568]|nr:hypothetical protein VR41_08920 [Streptomyces sp. NRRL B-1568]